MLILGHAGIALGTTAIIAETLRNTNFFKKGKYASPTAAEDNSPAVKTAGNSWFRQLGNYLDIRLLLIGSLLPDIIDKPLGQVFFKEFFSNGRIFGHTLLFLLVITLAGLYFYRFRKQSWLLVLSLGTFIHLACDQIWLMPRTMLWPVYGFAFERIELTGWMAYILDKLLKDPAVYLPELVGAAVLLWFAIELMHSRNVLNFIKHGRY